MPAWLLWAIVAALLAVGLRSMAAVGVLAASVLYATFLSPAVTKMVTSRLLHVAAFRTGTGRARLDLFGALLDDALRSPLFGHGAASYRSISERTARVKKEAKRRLGSVVVAEEELG